MSYKPNAIPGLPPHVDPQLRQFLTAIKENLEVRMRQRGSVLDAAPTFRDLLDSGLLKIKEGATTIGGRQYTAEQLLGLVEFTLPAWITSDTAPPAPTGLVVSTDPTNTILRWDASTFDQYAETEIWRATSNNLSLADKVGSTSGVEFTDGLPDTGVVYYYWIRDVSTSHLKGSFNDVNGAATQHGPSAATVFARFVGTDAELSWGTPTSNLAVPLYKIEFFDGAWQQLDVVAGNSHRFKVSWGGTRQFRLSGVDINGNVGPATQFSVTVTLAAAPQVGVAFDGEQALLTWESPSGSLPVDRYEVYDTTVDSGSLLATLYATAFRTKVTWLSKDIVVRAIDSAGNAGFERVVPVNVSPGQVLELASEVIDNNVLFRWGNAPGSLPIASYELRRGAQWATADVIGKKDGGFTTVFEAPQMQVVYTYWLAAIDTAGNYGPPASVSATVNQPPDYVLAANFTSTFSGPKVNAVESGGVLVLPVNTSETWAQHFTGRSWTGPSGQVAAGYALYAQPSATTGYYEEVIDYGATLVSMKVSVAYLLNTVAGDVSSTVQITTALDAAFTQNVQVFPGSGGYAINFRHIKVRATVTSTDNQGLAELSNLVIKLDTKLKTLTGTAQAVMTDVGGTTIYLTEDRASTGEKVFVDVESITVSAQGTTPTYAIYDFQDAYGPLSFKVLLFNSSGARVTGPVSYSIRGY